MARYVWRGGQFVCKKTGEPMRKSHAGEICLPQIRGDIKPYYSVVSNKMIDGAAERREDLKRTGCREVDPSEFRPKYLNKKFAAKRGKLDKYEGPDQ